ncbi:MAG: Type 1 glutamine amidotransferase-like domain-containing protein [Candidatus Dormiibacterota bacterium]
MPPERGRFLLLGSGEFEPWAADAERFALAGAVGDGSVAVLATASGREGEAVFERWTSLGLAHYESLDIRAHALRVRSRVDALAVGTSSRLDEVSMVFFSGGSPKYLAQTIAGTPLWDAVLRLIERGGVFGGCSAGAMVAGISRMPFPFGSGLDLLPGTAVGVHWDALSGWWIRWLRDLAPRRLPSQVSFFGIAEHTAIASDGDAWHVFGSGVVDVRRGSERHAATAGERFPR